jgi:hypothetical protein
MEKHGFCHAAFVRTRTVLFQKHQQAAQLNKVLLICLVV